MNSCELTAKEVAVIAASLGATELYGIEDEFSRIGKSRLDREIMKVQSGLADKGYLKENFDGEATLDKNVSEMVAVCAGCEKFIGVDKYIKNEPQIGMMYYIKGDKAIKSVKTDTGYKMAELEVATIYPELTELIEWKEPNDNEKTDFTVPSQTLIKVKSSNNDDVINEIIACGAGNSSAKTVMSGLRCNEDFYSFTFANLVAERSWIDNAMYIISDEKALRLTSDIENDEDVMNFKNATQAGIANEMKMMFDKLSISGEVLK